MDKTMNKFDSKLKFQTLTRSSFYTRVDAEHPLDILIGLNDYGQKTLRIVGNYSKTRVKGTKNIEVNHFVNESNLILSFSLINDDFQDLFFNFCNDMVDSSRNVLFEDGYTFFVNRFEQWRFFYNTSKEKLSEQEIKGLIGELLFLKNYLFVKLGTTKAISCWTGTEPTKKDFYVDDDWYEVKTATSGVISISSLEQLDSPNDGYLVVYTLEKASPESKGIDLNTLTNEMLDQISLIQDKTEFIGKLINGGYDKSEYYRDFVYQVNNLEVFRVTSTFPKLIKPNVPKAISKVKYDIIIGMIQDYKKELL